MLNYHDILIHTSVWPAQFEAGIGAPRGSWEASIR
jgi:hypothetical protein